MKKWESEKKDRDNNEDWKIEKGKNIEEEKILGEREGRNREKKDEEKNNEKSENWDVMEIGKERKLIKKGLIKDEDKDLRSRKKKRIKEDRIEDIEGIDKSKRKRKKGDKNIEDKGRVKEWGKKGWSEWFRNGNR